MLQFPDGAGATRRRSILIDFTLQTENTLAMDILVVQNAKWPDKITAGDAAAPRPECGKSAADTQTVRLPHELAI